MNKLEEIVSVFKFADFSFEELVSLGFAFGLLATMMLSNRGML